MALGLVVVDVQNAVIADLPDPSRFVEVSASVVTDARESGSVVVWVRYSADDLPVGSDGWCAATGTSTASVYS